MATKTTGSFNLSAALKASRKVRQEALKNPVKSDFETFDDGTYYAQLTGLDIAQSQSGRLQAIMKWKFIGGDYAGKINNAFQGLDTDNGWKYFNADLERLGYDYTEIDWDDAMDVQDLFKAVAKDKRIARVRLKTTGEFQNTRILNVLDEDEADDIVAENAGSEEADETDAEDADETPAPKAKKAKPAPKAKAKSKKADDEEEELEDETESPEADEEEEVTDEEEEEVVEEIEEEDDDAVAVAVGAEVVVKTSDGKKTGVVQEIFEKDNKLKVKTEDGKVYKLPADRLISVKDVPKKSADKPKGKAKK